ncbi:E3 SUMO-protein ligase RanBP2-like [Trichogramma pretiosum]|uniref:E3 SUMO-protein ligase RanBP2-like n=1 Tax=Trichogramma pretiosum TaxID=7493 RepID=UPI0006C9C109|nr:E3 SUMO-protein ligase RanBP2-like [Trichogramma pretiosum]
MDEKNKTVFDPPIKPRYLPGEVKPNALIKDFKSYKKHRLKVANAKAKVDNKAPKFDLDVYYNKEKLMVDIEVIKRNYKEVFEVTKKLNKIAVKGGKVDCWNFEYIDRGDLRPYQKSIAKQIEVNNKRLYNNLEALKEKKSEFHPRVMYKRWKPLKEAIIDKQRFPWPKNIPRYPSISHLAAGAAAAAAAARRGAEGDSEPRPRCFFDLELEHGNVPLGRVVFELYADYAPLACASFIAFCQGSHRGLSYRGSPFHRIVSDYWCQGGDVTKFSGVGWASIYPNDRIFEPKELSSGLRHTRPGVLSTSAADGFDSRFNLTFRPLKTVDDRCLVFGKVVKGMHSVYKISSYGSKFGKPTRRVIVSNCGLLPALKKKKKSIEKTSQVASSRQNHTPKSA